MPDLWVRKVQEKYNISDDGCDMMKQAALESQNIISLNVKNAFSVNRELKYGFKVHIAYIAPSVE